jgi:hypothetical protein
LDPILDLVHLLEVFEGVEDVLVLPPGLQEDLSHRGTTLGMKMWSLCSSASRALPLATISSRLCRHRFSGELNYYSVMDMM